MKKILILFTFLSVVTFGQSSTMLLLFGDEGLNYTIGTPGTQGFGVGTIAQSDLPSYIVPMTGTYDKTSDNYGNYLVTTDSSVMVFIPVFYYKITNVADAPYYGNKIEIRGYDYYGLDTTRAVDDGYALHRAFIDGGKIQKGFLIDKYSWSLTNVTWSGTTQLTGIASSRKNGNPISSAPTTKRTSSNNYAGSFSNCISNSQTPSDIYGGAWSVAKTRGNDFAVMSMYQNSALAMLSMAHQQASVGTTYCAWNDVLPYAPKGNNRTAVLGDYNDTGVTFGNPTDAYWTGTNQASQTGSGNPFNKTTHNGQNNGVADLNGNQWRIVQGITAAVTTLTISNAVSTDGGIKVQITTTASHGLNVDQYVQVGGVVGMTDLNDKIFKVTDIVDATNFKVVLATAQTYTSGGSVYKGSFYSLKESIAVKNLTGGNTLATDHFGATGITANYNLISLNFANNSTIGQRMGNGTNQLLSSITNRLDNDYRLTGLGLPLANSMSTGGNNSFGQDYYYEYFRNELCAVVGGTWYDASNAGVWAVTLYAYRTFSYYVSGRSCLYF